LKEHLLQSIKHVHLVGIGGIGLSAIARVLHGMGYQVSGSDQEQTALTAELTAQGIVVWHGHGAEHALGADLVIVSSAVPADNPEVLAANRLGIPVVKRAEVLGQLMAGKYGIAVAGTHGKTTTSALISFLLTELGLDPTFIVGGILEDLGKNAQLGNGPHFVIEADEYDYTFLGLRPNLAVVTVIEMDHPDCFTDIEDMTDAFGRFLRLLPDGGVAIGCVDEPRVVGVLDRVRRERDIAIVTYGLQRGGVWRAVDVGPNDWGGSNFVAVREGRRVGSCRVRLPGLHNVSNALAVLAVAERLDLDMELALESLSRFHGVRRRFELKGEARGIVVVDDYAHHPTEIRATLAAARRRYAGRPLWVFFQPHTFSRTKALLDEFAVSFEDADHVLISEIYAAREKDTLGITSADLVQRMEHPDVRLLPSLQEASDYLRSKLRPGDVLLTLGAGNGYAVGEAVLRGLRKSTRRGQAVKALSIGAKPHAKQVKNGS
jgi:UDP-N-acetylmuramate--alanine ligase